jgi:hypothetical protein
MSKLIIGERYVPHSKSIYGSLEKAACWGHAKKEGQYFLYYTGVDANLHVFSHKKEEEVCGDFFLESDVTLYTGPIKTSEMKYDNTVIKALTKEHGREIIKWWEEQGIITSLKGLCSESRNDVHIYYGIINGKFNNYSVSSVVGKVVIKTLEELQGKIVETQTISKSNLIDIHPHVCQDWQSVILRLLSDSPPLDKDVYIPNKLVNEAFNEADSNQKALLVKAGLKSVLTLNIDMLGVGEMGEITDGTLTGHVVVKLSDGQVVDLTDPSAFRDDTSWMRYPCKRVSQYTIKST